MSLSKKKHIFHYARCRSRYTWYLAASLLCMMEWTRGNGSKNYYWDWRAFKRAKPSKAHAEQWTAPGDEVLVGSSFHNNPSTDWNWEHFETREFTFLHCLREKMLEVSWRGKPLVIDKTPAFHSRFSPFIHHFFEYIVLVFKIRNAFSWPELPVSERRD